MTTCQYSFEDEDGNMLAPDCTNEATHISCIPYIHSLTCAEHKCRCAYPIGSQPEQRPKTEATMTRLQMRVQELEAKVSELEDTVELLLAQRDTRDGINLNTASKIIGEIWERRGIYWNGIRTTREGWEK